MTSVQVWDRYLLPLMVPLALLSGWALARLAASRTSIAGVLTLILLIVLVPAALQASVGRLPMGGDHGAYSGIDTVFDYVAEMSDGQNVALYQRELGWHARFYLYDALARGDVDLRYYPSATFVADSAAKLPGQLRLLIVPDWAPVRDLEMQLAARGLAAGIVLRAGHFTVYALKPQPERDASWRVCRTQEEVPALTAPGAGAMMCRQ